MNQPPAITQPAGNAHVSVNIQGEKPEPTNPENFVTQMVGYNYFVIKDTEPTSSTTPLTQKEKTK